MKAILFTVGAAFLASLLLTPVIRWAARRLGIVDRPDAGRKLHRQETALCGGVAVLLAFAIAIAGLIVASDSWHNRMLADTQFLTALAVAAALICGLGLADDVIQVRGRQKLIGQIVAASILVAGGLDIQKLNLFGWTLELGILAGPFAVLWLVAAINALNLIDGADGLATSVGLILSTALAGMAILTDHPCDAVLAIALVGALAGFLVYNRPPASIFLGDAGSMLIGLVLGALAIRSSLKGPATVALAAPTAIWAIPALDVAMAILRRKLTGRSIYTTDRGHLHHTLLRRGYGGYGTVAFIGALCGITALGAVISVARNNEWLAVASVAAVAGTLIAARLFGHHECRLLFESGKQFLLSLVPLARRPTPQHDQGVSAHLQGSREWDELWQTLTEFAERFNLHAVQLNVQVPSIGEDYHATWKRNGTPDERLAWNADIPLLADGKAIGRVRIAGVGANGSVCTWVSDLISGLKPFETHVLQIVDDFQETQTTPGGCLAPAAGLNRETLPVSVP